MKKPLAILVTGLGEQYYQYSLKMINSLKVNNPDIETKADIKLYTDQDAIRNGFTLLPTDLKMRYMTPIFVKELLQEYECVARLDSDMIITGDISSCWEGDFDVAVVQNANPRELQAQQQMMGRTVQVWDLNPMDYVNCGFVVVKKEAFVDNWLRICTPERSNAYQFYEQDFLNILVHYGDWKVKFLDRQPDNKWWGLISKGYGSQFELRGGKLTLPKGSGDDREPWPADADKEIICIHEAGGMVPKFTDIDIRYPKEIAEYLKKLFTYDDPKSSPKA